ncbi:MAG: hypothetical protein ACYTEQ_03805 [Planctomycetota bacterium]|jgi:hypothetical protein
MSQACKSIQRSCVGIIAGRATWRSRIDCLQKPSDGRASQPGYALSCVGD